MSRIFFLTSCNKCGKKTEWDAKKLGRLVKCPACHLETIAIDAESLAASLNDPIQYWLRFTQPLHDHETIEPERQLDLSGTSENQFLSGQFHRNRLHPR